MTKKIYIIRHAEAEDFAYTSALKDFDRNLTGKGLSQSARLGRYLFKEGIKVDSFISSPANRAFQTAKVILEQFKLSEDTIVQYENLYGGGPRGYLACLNKQSEASSSMALVGHNPDISFFVEYLTRDDIKGSMKKATMIELSFVGLTWAEISSKTGSFVQRLDVNDLLA
jgi:phosphohistidine phosphatase